MRDRLRSMGRLLQIAGEKLRSAANRPSGSAADTSAAWPGGGYTACSSHLAACGAALQSAAEALLRESWAEARARLTGAADLDPAAPFPGRHLSVFQELLAGPAGSLAAWEAALAALGRALEEHADNLSDALDASQDALLDAAGAIRAAARLFAGPRPRRTRPQAAEGRTGHATVAGAAAWPSPAGAGDRRTRQSPVVEEVRAILANPSREQRKAGLRELARRYHPDRHPGQELEVLPSFLYIQRQREDHA